MEEKQIEELTTVMAALVKEIRELTKEMRLLRNEKRESGAPPSNPHP
jgi:hypothetical protein